MTAYRTKSQEVQAVRFSPIKSREIYDLLDQAPGTYESTAEVVRPVWDMDRSFLRFGDEFVPAGFWLVLRNGGILVMPPETFRERYERAPEEGA